MARGYVGFWHNLFYYKKIHLIGEENIPPKGTPLIIASNHQNAVNDALAVEFAFADRPVSIFTRADLFSKPVVGPLLRSWYLLPAFRLGMDGADSLGKNFDVFAEAGERLLEGGSVMIFPEAVNQDKRWLGDFSQGYLRMAFDAAKRDNFQTDIQILPMVNHYSDYFHFQEDLLVRFGKPVSLKQYYEQYQSKPRTVQRNVNAEVRGQINDMMLNITDLENYEAIDYIRDSYGESYCESCGGDYNHLPDKLESDKALYKELENAKNNGEDLSDVYSMAMELKAGCGKYDMPVGMFGKKLTALSATLKLLLLALGLPLFLIALVPNILFWLVPMPIVSKLKKGTSHGAMFIGGVRFAINTLLVIPVAYTTVLLAEGFTLGWWPAVIHTALLPLLAVFAWKYRKLFLLIKNHFRFRRMIGGVLKPVNELRNKLFDKLDNILTKNTWKKE